MYLGIDLGTSALKILLLDGQQNIIGSASSALNVERPHSGWSEQDPASWIAATENALFELKSQHSEQFGKVRAIGLSGQMHGATLLDADDKILRPCMLWNDTRSFKQATALDARPEFRALTGNIVFPGFTAPKLIWVQQNEPEIFAKVAKVLLPKDYLRFWLTGEYISDPSDASGTSWFDVGKRCWSGELLAHCDMSLSQMPEIVEGNQVAGRLRDVIAEEFGLPKNIIIAAGGGDNAASAIGMGIVDKGSAFLSLGTSGVLFAANDEYLPNAASAVHAFCHALPDKWHQMGVILSATDALNWYARIAGQSPKELSTELGEALVSPGEVVFLPYLSGERTPHNDAAIRGSFTGLSHLVERTDLTRAVLEGVGFAFKDCVQALAEAGTNIERVTAIGGGSNSSYWLKAISTILDLPVDLPDSGDYGAAFGATRLAIMAADNAPAREICLPPTIEVTIEPDRSLLSAFDEAYLEYKSLYPALKA